MRCGQHMRTLPPRCSDDAPLRCRHGDWNNKDVDFLNANQLITSKPVVYLVNLTEKAYASKKSKWLPKVRLGHSHALAASRPDVSADVLVIVHAMDTVCMSPGPCIS